MKSDAEMSFFRASMKKKYHQEEMAINSLKSVRSPHMGDPSLRWAMSIVSQEDVTFKTFENVEGGIQYKINHRYLMYFSFVLGMFSTFSFGWILAEHGQVVFILASKLGWKNEGFINYVIICTLAGP